MSDETLNTILRTIDLKKRFGGTMVLDGLNMAVPEGAIYGLVGPNGVGKSTTIKILMNVQKPSGGRAEVFGRNSRRISPRRDLTRIGYVSENQEMPEWMTVEYFMGYLKPFYPAWDEERAEELLRQFDLPRDRKLRNLSHGMRMKAALASSLAYRPQLIVLDEPFTGLDPLVRDELIEGLLENADGATMLISSHDLAEIESFASHIGYLDRGRLQFSEEMSSLSQRFREIEVTLGGALPRIAEWPANWLRVERSEALVRFVDAQFERDRTMADIQRLFGEGRQVSVRPMPLREIFVTLARASRKAA
jgi:ABC-2 type transport system ATP-binding protein